MKGNYMNTIDQYHTFTVGELKETLKERTPGFDVYLWRCPYGKDEVVFEGYAKCPGGIKYFVWRYEKGVSPHAAKADLLEHGSFSPRPYQLAQACDGSVTGCALALLARFCRDCDHDAEALMHAAYPNEKRRDLNETVAFADWQGVAYPAQWDERAKAGLLESLHAVNYHSLASEVSGLTITNKLAPTSYQEPRPTKLLKITERFYGKVIYTSQADIDRTNKRGTTMIRCRCLNGKLVSHYHEEMGWHNKADTVFHREYLDGATIEEVEVQS
jgi:hypothetical protein